METKLGFEQALERLDEITQALSRGDVPLEESLSLYCEGARLLDLCEIRLKDAKLKIEALFPEEKTPKG